MQARKSLVIGRTSAALFLEVFNLLNTDDLRIFTVEPNKGQGAASDASGGAGNFDPQGLSFGTGPLQIDAVRRFGRRFQVGFQFDF